MDYQKFSRELSTALASDPKTTRLLDPSIIPSVVAVVCDTLADFEGKTRVPLPPPAPNPKETVEAVTHKPPVYAEDGEEITVKPSSTQIEPEDLTKPAEVEPEPAPEPEKEFVNFFNMTKNEALNWYYENKDEYGVEIEGIDSMKASEIKKALNAAFNEAS